MPPSKFDLTKLTAEEKEEYDTTVERAKKRQKIADFCAFRQRINPRRMVSAVLAVTTAKDRPHGVGSDIAWLIAEMCAVWYLPQAHHPGDEYTPRSGYTVLLGRCTVECQVETYKRRENPYITEPRYEDSEGEEQRWDDDVVLSHYPGARGSMNKSDSSGDELDPEDELRVLKTKKTSCGQPLCDPDLCRPLVVREFTRMSHFTETHRLTLQDPMCPHFSRHCWNHLGGNYTDYELACLVCTEFWTPTCDLDRGLFTAITRESPDKTDLPDQEKTIIHGICPSCKDLPGQPTRFAVQMERIKAATRHKPEVTTDEAEKLSEYAEAVVACEATVEPETVFPDAGLVPMSGRQIWRAKRRARDYNKPAPRGTLLPWFRRAHTATLLATTAAAASSK